MVRADPEENDIEFKRSLVNKLIQDVNIQSSGSDCCSSLSRQKKKLVVFGGLVTLCPLLIGCLVSASQHDWMLLLPRLPVAG